jgi:hypothetical protein
MRLIGRGARTAQRSESRQAENPTVGASLYRSTRSRSSVVSEEQMGSMRRTAKMRGTTGGAEEDRKAPDAVHFLNG